jgi:hypothetical protein
LTIRFFADLLGKYETITFIKKLKEKTPHLLMLTEIMSTYLDYPDTIQTFHNQHLLFLKK